MSVSRIRLGRYGTLTVLAAAAAIAQLQGCGTSASAPEPESDGTGATAAPAPKPAFVKLDRMVHPLARPESDVGPLDANRVLGNLSIVFKLTPDQERDRDALKRAQLDPASPSYHQWLTPEGYAARFGASADTVARTSAWLASHGLTVGATSRTGTRLEFEGRVADLQKAFQTELHGFQVEGKAHFATTSAPSVPGDLADSILAIHNLHDFFKHPIGNARLIPADKLPQYVNGTTQGIAPPDWTALYDVNAVYSPGINGKTYDGTGITIGIVGIAEIAQSDLNAFRTQFGLPASTVTMTPVPNTGAPNGNSGGAGVEAILDVEWSGAIAKGAKINYVATGTTDENVDDAVTYAIEQNVAPILSESWGGCEAGSTAADADVLQALGATANLFGITWLASSGDSGAAGCEGHGSTVGGLYVNYPASMPEVTSVGGTEFPTGTIAFGTNGYATAYPPATEEVWSEGTTEKSPGAGGGGVSSIFSRPDWQVNAATCTPVGTLPGGIVAANMRQVPDISAAAAGNNNGIVIECTPSGQDCSGTGGTPQTLQVGGTSASAPALAGVVALLNQAAGRRLGNINPILYALATSAPTSFHDITKGNNEIACKTTDVGCPTGKKYGFAATTGYDCGSGIGSLDVANLVTSWLALAPTSTSLVADPTTTTEGANVSLTATVNVPTPNSTALAGSVTFSFQSYLADGTTPDLSWIVGAGAITNGNTGGGTATLSVPIPPGLVKSGATFADVFASYGGDEAHLASTSAKVRITFGPIGFCVTPGSLAVAAKATQTFTVQGGVAPIKWYIDSDSTCTLAGDNCSTLDETTGAFVAGSGQAGYVIIAALDNDGAETFADVKVGSPTGAAPWLDGGASTCPVIADAGTDSGTIVDAGHDSGTIVDAGHDSGTIVDAGHDSGTIIDAGHDSGAIVDAGHDSGTIVDAGHDAGKTNDAGGGTTTDAGKTNDAGGDSGGIIIGTGDSGTNEDGSTGTDSGSTGDDDSGTIGDEDSGSTGGDASAPGDDGGTISFGDDSGEPGTGDDASAGNDAGSTTGGTGSSSGCGCTTAGKSTETPAGLFGALVLGLGLVARRRRSRTTL